jgi:predicted nucleic acid-binding protein
MGTVILDSSVVIALFDPEDAHHEAAAEQARKLRDEGAHFSAPATVLAEVLIGSVRRGPEAARQRKSRFINAFGRPRAIDEDVAVAAAGLRAQHKALRLPDALVIAVGLVDGADVVLTADKRWAQVDQRVRVIG